MKLLFIFIVVLIASASLALLVRQDPGYVLISYDVWSIETTLSLLVLALLALYFVLYYLIRLFATLWHFPDHLHGWSNHRKSNRARGSLHLGLITLAEGRWKNAERYLTKRVKSSDAPILNYLGAARAAQQGGNLEKRDYYLSLAHSCTDTSDLAVGLTQAELQIAQGQSEQALATLNHLGKVGRKNHYVLNLLKSLYLEFKDWESLKRLLPELRKNHVISDQALKELETTILTNLIQQAGNDHDLLALRSIWSIMPKHFRIKEDMLRTYSEHLNKLESGEEAETLIRKTLKKNWYRPLVRLYGLTVSNNPHKQLSHAEGWHKQYTNDPVLLLTLGRLCVRGQELEKAREYLKSSIQIEPATETYKVLGELLEKCGDKEGAMRCYRQGMLLDEKNSDSGNVAAAEIIDLPVTIRESLTVTEHRD
ncbi:MAG: heme biosynthesis protein HemY [Gammaproteobacteria bacterium]|nr:heme biosynthesis protein HemY [Gammaproteobacteria bacterium]